MKNPELYGKETLLKYNKSPFFHSQAGVGLKSSAKTDIHIFFYYELCNNESVTLMLLNLFMKTSAATQLNLTVTWAACCEVEDEGKKLEMKNGNRIS